MIFGIVGNDESRERSNKSSSLFDMFLEDEEQDEQTAAGAFERLQEQGQQGRDQQGSVFRQPGSLDQGVTRAIDRTARGFNTGEFQDIINQFVGRQQPLEGGEGLGKTFGAVGGIASSFLPFPLNLIAGTGTGVLGGIMSSDEARSNIDDLLLRNQQQSGEIKNRLLKDFDEDRAPQLISTLKRFGLGDSSFLRDVLARGRTQAGTEAEKLSFQQGLSPREQSELQVNRQQVSPLNLALRGGLQGLAGVRGGFQE